MRRFPRFGSERGVALLLVLWIIAILMVIAFSFSTLTRTEANSTLHFRETIQKKFYAEAGIERAFMELHYRQLYKNQTVILEGGEVHKVDGTAYTGQIGGGKYVFRIYDESGKININQMEENSGIILNNLLVNLGIPKEKADPIVDNILDWIDADNLHRLNGVEDEYYMSLPNPYKAKNGPIDTLEELLLVKDVTPEILYGTKERKGIINFITLYGRTTRLNVNAAPKEVLMAVPGMTEEIASKIIEVRQIKEIFELGAAQDILGAQYTMISEHVDAQESNAFTVEAVGFLGEEKGGYGIRATFIMEGAATPHYVYYKSPAEMRQ